MPTKIKNRIKSNRGDGNSVSHILWIAVASAVVSVAGLSIMQRHIVDIKVEQDFKA